MRRITVEEVKAAYAKVRIRPMRRDWGDGVMCGCPTMALITATGSYNHLLGGRVFELACVILGVDEQYLSGFIAGVDQQHLTQAGDPELSFAAARWGEMVPRFTEGVEDGTAVEKALWPEIE